MTAIAGAAVRIYRFVTLQTDGKYDESSGAQGRADGISAQAAAADGDVFAMQPLSGAGTMKVTAGAAVTVGAQIATDNQGRAIAHVSGAGNYILGVALTAANNAGEVIEIQTAQHQDGAT
jgi:hypothetical protein